MTQIRLKSSSQEEIKKKKQKSMLKEREDLNQLRKERMIIELQSDIHNTEYTLNARRFRNPDSEGSK